MKYLLFICSLLMAVEGSAGVPLRLKEYKVKPAAVVRMPLQGDSVNFTGKRFGTGELLKTRISLTLDAADCQTMATDTAGYLSLEKTARHQAFHVAGTRLRANRFCKGTLRVYSPARFEVYANGVLKQSKTTVQDSLPQVKAVSMPLTLEPEADCELTVKLLAGADDRLAPMLKCEFVPDAPYESVTIAAGPDMKRRFSLHNTQYGSFVNRVSLSPCGKYLLTRYVDNYDVKRSHTRTELTETGSGRVLVADANNSMAWMPRSSKAYYTVKGEEGNDLVVYNPATGEQTIAARNLPEESFVWAPTEDYLVFFPEEKGEKVSGPIKRLIHPDDRIPGSRERSHLARYDLASGLYERLTYGSHGVALNDISPDGTKWLCSTSKSDITQCPFSLTTIFELDLNTLQADTLVCRDAYVNRAMYSPQADRLLILGSPNAFGGVGRNCGSHPIANDFDVQAFIMDRDSRQVTPITRNFNPSIDKAVWNEADGCIYFTTVDKDCQHVYRYTPKDGKFTLLPLEEEVIGTFTVAARNAQVAAYIGGGNTSRGAAYLYDMRKQRSTLIANPMQAILDGIELGKQEDWNYTMPDGTVVEGQICLPPQFDPAKKYPLIVYYYGGTTPSTRGITSPYNAQVFASRDYVVYTLNPSGAIGYGQEFSARHVNAWGDYTADEIIECTRRFIEAHPFVDGTKVGCLGASYGGFMTMLLQTKTDLFAAAASHAGISDVTSYWGEGYWGYSYNSVAAAGSYPWSKPDLFTKHGALFNADKINTPLLLLHGTVDTNVPMGESIQLYNALKILGKPVEFLQVDGENHFISDYPKRVKWQNSIMAWFARYLQGDGSWWNELYPERHW